MENLRKECHDWLVSESGLPHCLEDSEIPATNGLLFALAGWVCICDWIASDERFFPLNEPVSPESARKNAEKALSSLGWFQRVPRSSNFASIFQNQQPRPLQTKLAELADKPGIYIVEAQMGDGKTKAALWAAHGLMSRGFARGLYFALPTQVTSERVLDEAVKPFVENGFESGSSTRLAHSAAWLRKESTPRIITTRENESDRGMQGEEWFSGGKRTLLAPFAVGTIDQALLGTLPRKHFFIRIAGLAGKVVVLDEVHSYDIYTGTLLCKLVELLSQCGCTIIILSATLASKQRAALLEAAGLKSAEIPDEDLGSTIITSGQWADRVSNGGTLQSATVSTCEPSFKDMSVRITCVTMHSEEIASELVSRASCGQKVLWIRNSVANAIEAYHICASAMMSSDAQYTCGLLHSRFTWLDRQKNESTWIERFQSDEAAQGCVLIATQVAEQSLNIDADFLVTDIAPTDLIFQRIGRLWRFRGRPRPVGCNEAHCWINVPDFSADDSVDALKEALAPLSKVYAPYVLLRSLEIWENLAMVTLPRDIRRLVDATYSGRVAEDEPSPAWATLAARAREDAENIANQAKGITDIWNHLTIEGEDDDAQTRQIRFPTLPLVLLKYPLSCPASDPWVFANGAEVRPPRPGRPFAESVDFRRAVMENSVKIPKWLLPRGEDWFPPILRQLPGLDAAVAWTDGERVLPWGCGQGSEKGWLSGFTYTRSRGLSFPAKRTTKPSPSGPESGEEDWW
jgi:CRISPR-associated endonuclease/helicase Cas3